MKYYWLIPIKIVSRQYNDNIKLQQIPTRQEFMCQVKNSTERGEQQIKLYFS